ncbi:MAG: heme exporter protein CcmD [Gammaproteobacteria bacterium]|nr:heme exporter protein CcmD [Gammaproteobacteria bacterium]
MSEFLAMGGYAIYVWPAFAITAIVMALNVWLAYRRERAVIVRNRRRIRTQL